MPEKNFEDIFFSEIAKKNFGDLFFGRALALVTLVLGLKRVCPRKNSPLPWPQIFCVLGISITRRVPAGPPPPPLTYLPMINLYHNGYWFLVPVLNLVSNMTADREDLYFGLHLIFGTNSALQPV